MTIKTAFNDVKTNGKGFTKSVGIFVITVAGKAANRGSKFLDKVDKKIDRITCQDEETEIVVDSVELVTL